MIHITDTSIMSDDFEEYLLNSFLLVIFFLLPWLIRPPLLSSGTLKAHPIFLHHTTDNISLVCNGVDLDHIDYDRLPDRGSNLFTFTSMTSDVTLDKSNDISWWRNYQMKLSNYHRLTRSQFLSQRSDRATIRVSDAT